MYQIKELLPELLPLLPGCESPVALQAVRAAGREFARESGAYLAAHLEELSESVDAVCVAVPDDAVIFRINRVFCGKRMLAPRSYRLDPANHTRVLLDKPTGQKGEVIRVEYSMLPTPLCNAYAEEFFNRYWEAVKAKALAELFAMPQKPWSNGELSSYHRAAYLRFKAEAIEEMESAGKPLDQHCTITGARFF